MTTVAALPPPDPAPKAEPEPPKPALFDVVSAAAAARLEVLLDGRLEELVLEPEELSSEAGLDGSSISLELSHYLHILVSTPGLRLAHVGLRGCNLNGTPAPENRGIFRPSLMEALNFVGALSKVWFTHGHLTSVDLAHNDLSAADAERLLTSVPYFAKLTQVGRAGRV